jgi:hypothetical protein
MQAGGGGIARVAARDYSPANLSRFWLAGSVRRVSVGTGMEAILEAISSLISLVIEITIAAVGFVFRLGAAAFSADYRRQLKNEWQESAVNKAAMTGAALFSITILAAVTALGMPLLFRKPMAPAPEKPGVTLEITIPPSGSGGTGESTKTERVLNAAGELLKRKLEERRQAKEAKAADDAGP